MDNPEEFPLVVTGNGFQNDLIATSNHRIELAIKEIRSLKNSIEELKGNLASYGDAAKREGQRMYYLTLILGFVALLQLFIGYKQMKISETQNISEQIQQAQMTQAAIERCNQDKNLEESGLFVIDTGKPASCEDVLRTYSSNSGWARLRDVLK